MHFYAGLYKIDHATKKELIPAKGYPMGPPSMPPWYPGSSEEKVNFTAECECFDCASFTITSCSLLQVACGWIPHNMAAQPCMPGAHMKIAILAQAVPWDYVGSMGYVGAEVYTDQQYFVAQQASVERYVLGRMLMSTFVDVHSSYIQK